MHLDLTNGFQTLKFIVWDDKRPIGQVIGIDTGGCPSGESSERGAVVPFDQGKA